jgi:MFS transporter, SET family, sugar efflux transporter
VKRLLVPSAALLWGLQIAFLIPTLALILATLYDASTAEVGWILTVYNASGLIASLLVPSYADRRQDYLRPMLACGVLTLVLALILAVTTSLPVAVVALIVVGGPAGVGSTLLFAHLRHSGATPADIVNTRAIVSVAWIAGPPLATLIIGAFGNRAILLAIGGIAILSIAITAVMITQRSAAPDHDGSAKTAEVDHLALRKRAVVLIVAAFVLLQAANATVTSIMTLFVTETMRIDIIWAGIALGVAAGLEVPALVLIGRLSLRFSSLRLITTGCVAGITLLPRDGLRHRARHAHRPPATQRLVLCRNGRRRTDTVPTDDSPARTVHRPLHEHPTRRRDRLRTDHRLWLDNCPRKPWHLPRLRPPHRPGASRHRNSGSTAGTAPDSRPGSIDDPLKAGRLTAAGHD